jgi:hypothetical protein
VNWYCSVEYQDVTKNEIWWNYCQLAFEEPNFRINLNVGDKVTSRTYLDEGTAGCFASKIHIFS